ncbi:MAG: hypothetical protein P9M13_01505 [Candidatus Ancaeobacter aquaticus]|nr:hypothetical protein [Candidatus Ancaeobacter aquaticus]
MFIFVSILSHSAIFGWFKCNIANVTCNQKTADIEFSIINAEQEYLVENRKGVKIYSKIIGPHDLSFFTYPYHRGYSKRYSKTNNIEPKPTVIEGRHEEIKISKEIKDTDMIDNIKSAHLYNIATEFCNGVKSMPPVFHASKIDNQITHAADIEKLQVPTFRLFGPVTSRTLIAHQIPYFKRDTRRLDITTKTKNDVLKENIKLSFWIDPRGFVKYVLILQSSGSEKIDLICTKALKAWQFSADIRAESLQSGTIYFFIKGSILK